MLIHGYKYVDTNIGRYIHIVKQCTYTKTTNKNLKWIKVTDWNKAYLDFGDGENHKTLRFFKHQLISSTKH